MLEGNWALGETLWLMPEVYDFSIEEGIEVGKLVSEGFYHVNANIKNRNFPIRKENCGDRRVRLIQSNLEEVGETTVIKKALEFGLKRPSHEDAIFFAAKIFKKLNFQCEIIFLHNPILVYREKVIALSSNSLMGNEIYLHRINVTWSKSTMFAFLEI